MEAIEREAYFITEEQMEKVNTYVPLKVKTNWVSMVAERCLQKIVISATIGGQDMDLPPVYKEDLEKKCRYLMGALVRFYLCGTFEPEKEDDDALMPEAEYDKWAGGHIFSQIEKFKSNKDLRDTCFNMLNDYKDLEKRLNAECYALLTAMNDDVARQLVAMQATVTPESFQELVESFNEIKDMENTNKSE